MHLKAILVLLAAVMFALMPLFVTDFQGFSPEAFPIPQKDAPIQPAGYVFSIWALIYAWLAAGMAFGLFKRVDYPRWDKMRMSLLVSLVIGIFWLPVAQFSPIWATLMIWLMLLSAIKALFYAPKIDRVWARAPVSIYAGWLTVASAVALALVLAGHDILSQHNAAILMLFVALGFAAVVQITLGRAPLYSTTVAWGLMGIVVANINAQTPNLAVGALAGVGLVFMCGLAMWAGYRHTFSPDDSAI
jgi:hypothetical protein